MNFPLNPNAAEFVPVSPQSIGTRLNLTEDYPIAGSPLKQISQMDDIQVPSQSEFEEEVCHRPRDIEDEEKEECTNGVHIERTTDFTDFMMDKQKPAGFAGNLDDSEISSTKAEFGDESAASFLTASEFHRTGVSTVDDSFANSERDYHIATDPMAMSLTPSDFEAAFDKGVDLNAVHDLTGVQMEDKNDIAEEEDEEDLINTDEKQPEVNGFPHLETERTEHTIEPDKEEQSDILHTSESQLNEEDATLEELAYKDDSETMERQEEVQKEEPPEGEELEKHDAMKFEQSPLTDNYSPGFESEKEPVSVDNEQPLSPSSIDVDETKPIDEVSDDAVLLATDSQKESNLKDEDTPLSRSPVPDAMECTTPPKDEDMISSMHNLQISSTPIASSLNRDIPKYVPDHYYNRYAPECDMPSSTSAEVDEKLMDPEQEDPHVEKEEETIPEQIASPEPIVQKEETKGNLVDFEDEREVCTKSPVQTMAPVATAPLSPREPDNKASQDLMSDLLCPMEPKPVVEEQKTTEHVEDLIRTDMYELGTPQRDTTYPDVAELEIKHETPGMNLSESMQEFTGLEKQLQPEDATLVETKPAEIIESEVPKPVEPEIPKQVEPEILKEDEPKAIEEQNVEEQNVEEQKVEDQKVEEHAEPLTTVPPHEEKAEVLIAEIVPENKEAEVEKEKVEVLEKEQVKEHVSLAATAAVAVAATATAAAAATTAAATTAKAKAKAPAAAAAAAKPTKTTTTPKTTTRTTPGSPSKTTSATARASATAAAKKSTSSVTSRSKESEATKKPSAATTTASKSTASKPATAASKSATTVAVAKTTTRTALSAPKPKSTAASPKPATTASDKKPTANGEIKSPSKTAPPKTASKPSATTASAATKVAAAKSSSTTRTTVGSAATKARTVSATSTVKTTTVKSSPSTTSTTAASAPRPKTAPITSTTVKSRVSNTQKLPLIDKQIKETANKQISARTSSSSTSKTTTRMSSSSTTTTSAKRMSTSKTGATTGSPTKKAASAPKVSGRIQSSTTKTGNSVTKATKVVQNGVSETEITSTTIISTEKIEDDIPKKDLSPVVAPTDNQLIMTSD